MLRTQKVIVMLSRDSRLISRTLVAKMFPWVDMGCHGIHAIMIFLWPMVL